MLKRSQSRMRPRHFRSSSTSPRVHQPNARILGLVGVVLLLFTVVFLYAKLSSPSSASEHGSSHEFSLGRRLITELPTDGHFDGSAHHGDVERASHENGFSSSSKSEVDPFYEDIPKQSKEVKNRNGSVDLENQDYVHEDEEDTLDDDGETDADLQVNGIDEFENAGNNAADGLDDMDDDDDWDDQDDADEQQEELDKKIFDSNESFEKEVHVKANMVGGALVDDGKLQAFENKHESEKQVPNVVLNSTLDFPNHKLGNSKFVDNGLGAEESQIEKSQIEQKAVKSLSRSGRIRTIPRWDPLEGLGSETKSGHNLSSNVINRIVSNRRDGIIWDHLLSVARKAGNPKKPLDSDEKSISETSNASEAFINQREKKSSIDSLTARTEIFSSDDEPLDQEVSSKLEEVKAIEDALLLPNEKGRIGLLPSWVDIPVKRSNKGDTNRRERSSKFPLDVLNPANNPLLQDPDTSGPNGLSATDKALLRALRKTDNNDVVLEPGKEVAKDSINENSSLPQKVEVGIVQKINVEGIEGSSSKLITGGNAAERSILEIESTYSDSMIDKTKTSTAVEKGNLAATEAKAMSSIAEKEVSIAKELNTSLPTNVFVDTRRWGFFPGYNPLLTFSEFLQHFLMNNNCSLRIFMSWTSPPWAYSVRYQRGLESLLHFHLQACIVVFSESIELNFFSSFVEEGFKVAVVAPNLEELLEDTPTDIFASVWLTWRKTPLFHIHYTELLRLAALYKYGGIYLDTDVIILKPLDSLQNSVGAEDSQNHVHKLNGAVMAFEKNSPFLWECLAEFTATYDDQLLEFNGAELLMRVVNRTMAAQSGNQQQQIEVRIMPPYKFFPLSRQNITRYFQAPSNEQQQRVDDQLLQLIYDQSLTLHFWNKKTARLVPEKGSLVERVINNHCIRCLDFL